MKQKYLIYKDDETKELIIREFAESVKEVYSLLCEETYDSKEIESAIAKDKKTLVSTIRTKNFFPIRIFAEKIADAIIDRYNTESNQSMELFLNDADLLKVKEKQPLITDDTESTQVEIDELLKEDTIESGNENEDPIKNITSPHKIKDDDSVATKDKKK
jgi:hypothetical protein